MEALDLNNIAKKLQDQSKSETIHLEAETTEVVTANLFGIERQKAYQRHSPLLDLYVWSTEAGMIRPSFAFSLDN